MIRMLIIMAALLGVGGCQSTMEWEPEEPVDANCPGAYVLKGEAADVLAESMAQNMLDDQGIKARLHKYDATLYVSMVGLLVAGLIFWGLTRSHWGWVIPAGAVCGLAFIEYWPQYGKWIAFGLAGTAVGLLIWKAREYQKERDTYIAKEITK